MKRIVFMVMLGLLILAGCGRDSGKNEGEDVAGGQEKNENSAQTPVHEFDVQVLADELLEGIDFEDELGAGRDVVLVNQYELEEGVFVKQASYFSSNATTEEIVVVECEDEAKAKELEKAFEDRVAARKSVFADYAPDEVKRLDGAVIKVLGRYVVLCVCAEPETAEAIIDKY